jgi:hypothetical protein
MLGNYLEDDCINQGLYCGYCCEFGHSSRSCRFSFAATLEERKPLPLPPNVITEGSQPILWVVDTPQCIRAVLSAYSQQPSGRAEENRKRLVTLARGLGRRLIYKKSA